MVNAKVSSAFNLRKIYLSPKTGFFSKPSELWPFGMAAPRNSGPKTWWWVPKIDWPGGYLQHWLRL